MSEIDDLEQTLMTPERRVENAGKAAQARAGIRTWKNIRDRAIMRRKNVSDKEADAIYARALAEIRAKA